MVGAGRARLTGSIPNTSGYNGEIRGGEHHWQVEEEVREHMEKAWRAKAGEVDAAEWTKNRMGEGEWMGATIWSVICAKYSFQQRWDDAQFNYEVGQAAANALYIVKTKTANLLDTFCRDTNQWERERRRGDC